jgi:DNA polymerase-4
LVEPLSLDEAYLDVTDYLRGGMTAWTTAKEIRKRIHDETVLTASAGISYNKFLAKLASDQQKPNGQFAIMPDEGEAFIANLGGKDSWRWAGDGAQDARPSHRNRRGPAPSDPRSSAQPFRQVGRLVL